MIERLVAEQDGAVSHLRRNASMVDDGRVLRSAPNAALVNRAALAARRDPRPNRQGRPGSHQPQRVVIVNETAVVGVPKQVQPHSSIKILASELPAANSHPRCATRLSATRDSPSQRSPKIWLGPIV